MIHPPGSVLPRVLGGVFCQCRSAETPPGPGPGPAQPGDHEDPSCEMYGGPDQQRLKVLFQVLDVNGDGGICVNDLTIGLKKLGVHRTEHELRVSGPGSASRTTSEPALWVHGAGARWFRTSGSVLTRFSHVVASINSWLPWSRTGGSDRK